MTTQAYLYQDGDLLNVPGGNHQEMIFLSLPYSGTRDEIEERVAMMARFDAELMTKGFFTVSPVYKHLMRQHVENTPGDWAYWGEYSIKLINRCDRVIVLCLDGWEKSVGVEAEIAFALSVGIPVYYIHVDNNKQFSSAVLDARCVKSS